MCSIAQIHSLKSLLVSDLLVSHFPYNSLKTLSLRFECLQKGAIVIPRSSNPLRIQENVKSWTDDVKLDADDMRILNMLSDGHKYCWDPKNVI